MQDIFMEYYQVLRALHIISVIAWMAGLLYLPRLFVYHAEHVEHAEISALLKTMERRLFRYIMNPAFIASWVFGGAMLYANPALMSGGWMHVKLTAVLLLSGFHHVLGRWGKDFAADKNTKSPKFYRIMNEIPTVLMIIIVIMAVVEPF